MSGNTGSKLQLTHNEGPLYLKRTFSSQAIEKPDKWALHELRDLPTHAVGRVCIVGDSAAATLPHQGQGAAQAMEGGYTLSTLLGSPQLKRSNAQIALQVYNELR